MGDIIRHGQSVDDFLSDVDRYDQHERQRDLAAFDGGAGAEDDEHEHNAACTPKSRGGEQYIGKSADKRGQEHHRQQLFAAVFFLQHGTDQCDDTEIIDIMREIRMSEHIADHPEPHARIRPGSPETGEICVGTDIGCRIAEHQDHERK